jgi:hypothetical protein
MSENVTTLQDSNFLADISFISVNRETGHCSYLPIDLASVTYFEINDNLIDFGLTGNVTFPNWGQLLNKLQGFGFQNAAAPRGDEVRDTTGVATGMEKYLTISIKDSNIPIEEQGYEFVASAKSSATLTLNAIDVKQTMEFEENLTAVLKKISYDVFVEAMKEPTSDAKRQAFLKSGETVAKTLLHLLEVATDNKAIMTEEVVGLDAASGIGKEFHIEDIDAAFDGQSSSANKSLYSIAQDLYNHISFSGPGVFDILNDPNTPRALRGGSSLPLLKTKHDPIDIGGEDADEEAEEEEPEGFATAWKNIKGLVQTAFSFGKTEEEEEEEEPEVNEDSDTDPESEELEELEVVGKKPGNRKLVIDELLSQRHLEFISGYKKLPPEVAQPSRAAIMQPDVAAVLKKEEYDFSDVYMEDFSIAPDDVPNVNASIHNNVEKYDLIQPDINNLRQTIWGNYEIINSSIDNQQIDPYQYNKLANEFESKILGGHKSNLPSIPTGEAKLFKVMQTGSTKLSLELSEARLRNVIFKSFIYLNETIVLDVKGKMYRKPGKFITIQGDLCPSKAQQLWFVIEVKHKFENGNYRNEIKAVRFLADGPIVERSTVLRGLVAPDRGPDSTIRRTPVPVMPGGPGGTADGRAGRDILGSYNTGLSLDNVDGSGNIIYPDTPSLFNLPGADGAPLTQEEIKSRSRAAAEKKLAAEEERKKNGFDAPPQRSNSVRVVVPTQEEE